MLNASLATMGYAPDEIARAIEATGGESVDAAVAWIAASGDGDGNEAPAQASGTNRRLKADTMGVGAGGFRYLGWVSFVG